MSLGGRLLVLIDSSGPLARIERELAEWREWRAAHRFEDSIGVIVYGERASWVPEAGTLPPSILKNVGVAARPALKDAFERVVDAHAVVVLAAREPAVGWIEAAKSLGASFRAAVSLGETAVAAVGQGHLGAAFRGEHLGLCLRWLSCEVRDRTWVCVCGKVRVYGAACCGAAMPPRLRIGKRVIVLGRRVALFAHHLGRPLAFDEPVFEIEEAVAGEIVIDGVRGEIRVDTPQPKKRSRRFRPPPLRADSDRCHACKVSLATPALHRPPDPRRYCAGCVAEPGRCDFCAMPVGKRGGNVWPDGRTSCDDCWSTALGHAEELEELDVMGRAWMERKLGMRMPPCPLYLEHAAAIAEMHGDVFRPSADFTPRRIGFFRKAQHPLGIAVFIEHGTPRSIAYGVLVHELTHLWQAENWAVEPIPTIVEGLAMWVEYQALLAVGAIHAARTTELYGDPIYGLGFRIALAVEKEVGFDLVKDRLLDVSIAAP